MSEINFGKYIALSSFVHKLNPVSKIFFVIFLIIETFLISNWLYYIIPGTLLVIFMLGSKIRISLYFEDVKKLWFLILIIFLLQFTSGVNLHNLFNAIETVLRIIIIVLLSSIFIRTTRPVELARSVEKGLILIRVRRSLSRDISMTLVLVMQFIPVLLKEINRIRTAQMIRGSKMSRGIFKGLQTVISIMIPLVISTMRRAEQVAIAMESRRYGMYDNTTSYYKSEINLPDVVVIVLSVVLLILPAVLSKLLIK